MRKVYIGSNGAGKTRQIIMNLKKLLEEDDKLIAVGNIPLLKVKSAYNLSMPQDENKVSALMFTSKYLYNLYSNSKNDEFTEIETIYIKAILSMLCQKGDILVLDDIDSVIPAKIVREISMALLKVDDDLREFANQWKHVLMSGYSEHMLLMTSDNYNNREAIFVDGCGNEQLLIGGDNIDGYLYR